MGNKFELSLLYALSCLQLKGFEIDKLLEAVQAICVCCLDWTVSILLSIINCASGAYLKKLCVAR